MNFLRSWLGLPKVFQTLAGIKEAALCPVQQLKSTTRSKEYKKIFGVKSWLIVPQPARSEEELVATPGDIKCTPLASKTVCGWAQAISQGEF